jgi:molecular chaperone GrpE (heat shock protein)
MPRSRVASGSAGPRPLPLTPLHVRTVLFLANLRSMPYPFCVMNNRAVPRISKWAFMVGDLLLLAVAGWIVHRQAQALNVWQAALVVASVALGAWIAAAPFVMEYRTALRFAEADELVSAVTQIQKLQLVGEQIRLATGQWQTVQEHSERSVNAAREIADRMAAEAKNFTEFMQKANDSEKAHLRLEVDKAKRAESEWLQLVVRLLDHVYALYMAGVHSGQPRLREQLGQFQGACREIVRRVGLIPVEAEAGEPFDEMKHQAAGSEAEGQPPAGACIAETVATGYTFQGQLLRPPLVRVAPLAQADPKPEPPSPEEAPRMRPEDETAIGSDQDVALETEPESDSKTDPQFGLGRG